MKGVGWNVFPRREERRILWRAIRWNTTLQ